MSITKNRGTPSTSSLAVAASADSSSAFAAAYERRLPEMMALRESGLGVLNVQPYTAVTTVLGTVQQIRSLREAISTLQSIDKALVGRRPRVKPSSRASSSAKAL